MRMARLDHQALSMPISSQRVEGRKYGLTTLVNFFKCSLSIIQIVTHDNEIHFMNQRPE